MEKYKELVDLVNSLEVDVVKFYEKGNNAAGTRVRKGLLKVRILAQDFRNEISDIKNSK